MQKHRSQNKHPKKENEKKKENQESPRYALVIDHFVNPIMDQRSEECIRYLDIAS
jgi:hypothetical protein